MAKKPLGLDKSGVQKVMRKQLEINASRVIKMAAKLA